ncbi:MAG TPA: hypothetical protein VIG47_18055, partial [Gemmatimonadaceae bacterium]
MTTEIASPEIVSTSRTYDEVIGDARAFERNGNWCEARAQYEHLLRDMSLTPSARSSVLRWMGRAHAQEGNPNLGLDVLAQA